MTKDNISLKPNTIEMFSIQHIKMWFKPTSAYGEWIFDVITEVPFDTEKARIVQKELGRHPAGYGFYGFHTYTALDGSYYSQWICSNSCE